MDSDDLKTKAKELWELIVKLETERYDLEERTRRQDYDVRIKEWYKALLCSAPKAPNFGTNAPFQDISCLSLCLYGIREHSLYQ